MDIFEVMFPWWSLLGLALAFVVACVACLRSWRSFWTIVVVASVISAALFCYGLWGVTDFYACEGMMRWMFVVLGVVMGPFYIIGGVRFVCVPVLSRERSE